MHMRAPLGTRIEVAGRIASLVSHDIKKLLPGQVEDIISNVIPSGAMVFDDQGTQVATVTSDDRIHFKPIAVSKILDATVEVTEGVSENDRIVNNPSAALLEGDKVRIVTPAPGYDLAAQEAPASPEQSPTTSSPSE